MSPQDPSLAGAIGRINGLLMQRLGDRALVRVQLSFLAGAFNVSEPNFAVIPGVPDHDHTRHPERVAESWAP